MTDPDRVVRWWQAEPTRLERDRRGIEEAFPDLALTLEGEGYWSGRLPMWPFDRPEPPRLGDLLHGQGLELGLVYTAAYPMVSPNIVPSDPVPLFDELTQTRWHVLGNGALCLFQTQADWDPASSVVDLLRRAAGWRVEYALLKSGVRTDMTLAGIAHDDSLDGLIAEAAERLTAAESEPGDGGEEASEGTDPTDGGAGGVAR